MEELGIDPLNTIIISLFVAGFVEMIKYTMNHEWGKAATILMAGIAGGVSSLFLGINLLVGICAGFASSGLITVVKRVGDY